MFKWLANLIIHAPVQGTCSCGAQQRAKLRKMQKAVLTEKGQNVPDDVVNETENCACGCSCGQGDCCTSHEAHDCCCESGRHGECRCGGHYHHDEQARQCQNSKATPDKSQYDYAGMKFEKTSLKASFSFEKRKKTPEDSAE